MKFSVGYNEVHEKVAHSPRHSMSCGNCVYFSQEIGDKEEVCQNNEVTEYDIVVDGHNTYCTFWKQIKHKEDNLFSKTYRSGRHSL